MNKTPSRTRSKASGWPKKVTVGRCTVTVYVRKQPNRNPGFLVANYINGKRRFCSYTHEESAIAAAKKIARQLNDRNVLAAAMTKKETGEYAATVQRLAPFNVGLLSAADAVVNALAIIGGFENVKQAKEAVARCQSLPSLTEIHAAAKFYRLRYKHMTSKRVADVVTELLDIKKALGANSRYLEGLGSRLTRFGEAFQRNISDVTTAHIQQWLDSQTKLAPRELITFRRSASWLFQFAVARGYALDNPVDGVEHIKVRK